MAQTVTVSTTRSTARTALGAHCRHTKKAGDAANEASRPVERARDQVERAEAALLAAQAVVSLVDEKEAASLKKLLAVDKAFPPPGPTPAMRKERAEAEETLAAARRALSTIKSNYVIAEAHYNQAAQAAAELTAQTPAMIEAVLSDEADAALDRMRAALVAATEAETEVNSFSEFFAAQRMFRLAERVNVARNTMTRPQPQSPNTLAVIGLASALETNSDAALTTIIHQTDTQGNCYDERHY